MNDHHRKARAEIANLELHSLAAGRQYDPYGQKRISLILGNEWSRLGLPSIAER